MSATLYGETEARYAALSGLVHGARVLDLAIHGDARHDAKERALAGAVRADDADLRAEEEGERDVFEDALVGRMDAGNVLHREDVFGHGGPVLTPRRRAPQSSVTSA
jgi:hypothetical protein